MSVKPSSLSAWMKLVVLLALDLALFQGVYWLLMVPFVTFLLLALNVVVIRTAIRGRGPGAFDAAFLMIGAAYFVAATAMEASAARAGRFSSLGILQGLIDLYRVISGDTRVFRFNHPAAFVAAERLATTTLGLVLAVAAGLLASWYVRRRPGRGLATMAGTLQGAILGLAAFTMVAVILAALWDQPPRSRLVGWVGLLASPLVGGLVGGLATWMRPERS